MTNFTPGPYLFEKQHCGKYLVLAERPNKCPIEVAECFSEPNARLFAAAPEMHKVLDNLYDYVPDIMFFMPNFAQKLQRMIVPILRRIDGDTDHE